MDQIEKNTVSAKNQLKVTEYVTYINPEGKGKRFLFVGNSITRHGRAPQIGWDHDFGMAASAIEKDYVHLLQKMLEEKYPDAVICVCQAAAWERSYMNGEESHAPFQAARDFGADYIVMRIVENCDRTVLDHDVFLREYKSFIDFLNTNDAKIILTSGFWKHVGDEDIEKAAKERNYPFIALGDLGEDDEMKAIGLFEHSGVANHPGDKGMRAIAERIFALLADLPQE